MAAELNLAVKYVMSTYCNQIKNEEMLQEGLAAFSELREREVPRLFVDTPHELLHAIEVLNLIDIGEAILHSSLARKASSRALGFYRPDHPELDPPEWRKWVSIRRKSGKIVAGTRAIGLIRRGGVTVDGPTWQPIRIDPAVCTRCNACVEACPNDVLAPNPVDGEPPVVLHPCLLFDHEPNLVGTVPIIDCPRWAEGAITRYDPWYMRPRVKRGTGGEEEVD